MFQHITDFCRRLFSSKGFRRGLRIFSWVVGATYLCGLIRYFTVLINNGVSFREALEFLLFLPFYMGNWILAAASIAFGIAVGLIWSSRRKRKNSEEAEPNDKAEEAEPDEKAEEPAQAAPEEEIIETTHYMFH